MMDSGKVINKEIVSNMEWTKGHPEEEGAYLVCEIRQGRTGRPWLEVEILVWNPYDECWDTEDGDDFYCHPEKVYCWMPLPNKPDFEDGSF